MERWDTIYAGGYLVDPRNHVEAVRDIAVKDGRVAEVGRNLNREEANAVVELKGKTVVPGIIDSHVHLSGAFGGAVGFRMLAKTGVVTAIDFSGDVGVLKGTLDRGMGVGINVGFLKAVIPEQTIASSNPSGDDIERFLDLSIEEGALGIKLLGGHYPLEPDAFSAFVKGAGDRGIFAATHVGTTRHGSNLDGLKEAVKLAEGHPLYIAHLNSYCRGLSGKHPVVEAGEAIELVSSEPNIIAESYIADINGTAGRCSDGVPVSGVTRSCLTKGGFHATEEGLEEAILNGYAWVRMLSGGEIIKVTGEDAARYWREKGTRTGVSFKVNSLAACLALATARDKNGDLIVDILSTDGGSIPRNTLIQNGLALCRIGALSLKEFVCKASYIPAQTFGLEGRGHLGVGAYADLTIFDLEKGIATMSVAGGNLVMIDGILVGSGGHFIEGGA
jgi:hypothetical protein